MGGEASREEVVAWMVVHEAGYKAAAKHFGLGVDKVKYWARVAREHGDLPPLERGGNGGESEKGGVEGGGGKRQSPYLAARARDAEPQTPPPRAYDEQIVAKAREAYRLRIEWLARPESLKDKEQVKVAATAELIVRGIPQAVSMPKATPDADAQPGTQVRRLAHALRVSTDAPPALVEVAGGAQG